MKIVDLNFKWLFRNDYPDFKFEYPEEITVDKYLEYLNLAYEKFWFEVCKELNVLSPNKEASQQDFTDVLNKCNLPNVKEEIYRKLGYPITEPKVNRIILKTYLSHVTNPDFHKQVLEMQTKHKDALYKLVNADRANPHHSALDPVDSFFELRK